MGDRPPKFSSDYDLEAFLTKRKPGQLMWEQFRYPPNLGQDAYDAETERLLQEMRDTTISNDIREYRYRRNAA